MNWLAVFAISLFFGIIAGSKNGPIFSWALLAAIVAGTLAALEVI